MGADHVSSSCNSRAGGFGIGASQGRNLAEGLSRDSLDCSRMAQFGFVAAIALLTAFSLGGQPAKESFDFKLVLPDHPGQLRFTASGFKVVETSAKPEGSEIGIRGKDASGRLTFLAFLFLFPEQAPLTSAKCREGVLASERKDDPTFRLIGTTEIARPGGVPLSLVTFTTRAEDGTTGYRVRGFVATGDVCGDLDFYSASPIGSRDADLQRIFASYLLDTNYVPTPGDIFLYAETLFRKQMFKEAAPYYESALAKLRDNFAPFPSAMVARRVMTDQSGISYGLSGDIPKARAIFQKALAGDPNYPMYYYNLACADAQEQKLADARVHLQAAFVRKANLMPGERIPDPTKDDSFLPYRADRDFWAFLERLAASDNVGR